MWGVECHDSRKCFGKDDSLAKAFKDKPHCTVLSTPYQNDGECPFCKPDRAVTNEVFYPYRTELGK